MAIHCSTRTVCFTNYITRYFILYTALDGDNFSPTNSHTANDVPQIIFHVEFPWRKLCYFFFFILLLSTFTHIHTYINIKFKFLHLFIHIIHLCACMNPQSWILFIRQSHHVFTVVVFVFIHFFYVHSICTYVVSFYQCIHRVSGFNKQMFRNKLVFFNCSFVKIVF